MELRQLKQFATIVRFGHVGRAAIALGITQPALTKNVRKLEAELGCTLLERRGRGIEPSAFGLTLARYAELIGAEVHHAVDAIDRLRQTSRRQITVGAAPSVASTLLPAAVARLTKRDGDLQIVVIEGLMADLAEKLRTGAIEFSVGALSSVLTDGDLRTETLFKDRVVAVARRGHPLARRRALGLGDLLAYPWVMTQSSSLLRQWVDETFILRGMPTPRVISESGSADFVLRLIAQSDCIGLVADRLLAASSGVSGFATLAARELVLERPVGIAYRNEAFLTPESLTLIDELRLCAKDA